jgi:DNA polymerase-3 subunit gamma/tau
MGHAVNLGRDPRTLTEQIVRHLRNAFLSIMAPELVVLPADQVDAIAQRAQQLGAATLVRAIEQLGSTLVEMRHAPDPRILVEVALVQLTHDEAGNDVDALLARIERLEQTVKQLRESGVPAGAAAAPAAPRDPATGRAVLGGAARRDATGATPRPAAAAAPEPASAAEPEPAAAPVAAPAEVARSVPDAWEHTVKGQVKPLVRALYSAGSFVGREGDVWQFAVPNEAQARKCSEHQPTVEAALSTAIGEPVSIAIKVSGGGVDGGTHDEPTRPAPAPGRAAPRPEPAPAAAAPAAPASPAQRPVERAVAAAAAMPDLDEPVVSEPPPPDDEIDLSELTDAPPESVKTPLDRLAEAFPGSELINDD